MVDRKDDPDPSIDSIPSDYCMDGKTVASTPHVSAQLQIKLASTARVTCHHQITRKTVIMGFMTKFLPTRI
jgi:hypothetical protein